MRDQSSGRVELCFVLLFRVLFACTSMPFAVANAFLPYASAEQISGSAASSQSPLRPPGGESQVSLRSGSGKEPDRPRIEFDFLRYNEDWTFLRDPAKRVEFWDRLKYLPLSQGGSAYVTLGGESRQVYEFYHNQYWGAGPQDDNGWLTMRYMAHADLHFGPQWRVFGQLQSALENGRNGGPRPYDKDKLDLHQAFIDYRIPEGRKAVLTIRAGRQEMFYGSGRLIEAREGLNTRISFDGFKVLTQFSHWKVDGFAVRPTLQKVGYFDDTPDSQRMFWGVYGTTGFTRHTNLDLYYLGLNQKLAAFDKGSAQQVRQTVGGRWSGNNGAADFDDEVVGQFGTFGSGQIRAWGVALEHGYTLQHVSSTPRVGIRTDFASGDNDPNGRNLGTLSPLFGKGKYFGEADLNGPSNTIDVQPSVALHVPARTTLTFDYGAFWRESTRDGLYGFATNLERTGQLSTARLTGQQAEFDVDHVVNPHLVIRAVYQHFFAGQYLKQTPPGRDVNYVTGWFDYHF